MDRKSDFKNIMKELNNSLINKVHSPKCKEETKCFYCHVYNPEDLNREINDYIVGVTPRLLYVCGRGDEIQWFINHINSDVIGDFVNDDFEIDHYVIVDDETFDILDEQKQHLIHVDNNTGLTEDNIKEIENKLYGQL
jgi:hypothetical protein